MAIYHLHLRHASRAKGDSASAKHDYITRQRRFAGDDRDRCRCHWSGNLPSCADGSAAEFWAAADAHERANGRLCRSYDVALPREFNADQQRAAAEALIQAITQDDLPYTAAIHDGDGINPHLHLMVSDRISCSPKPSLKTFFSRHNAKKPDISGAKKTTRLNSTDALHETRKIWETIVNQMAEELHLNCKIDCGRTAEIQQNYSDTLKKQHQTAVAEAEKQRQELQKLIEEQQKLQEEIQKEQQKQQEEQQKKERYKEILSKMEARRYETPRPCPRPTPR